jgi:hypothetical protein
VKEFVPIPSVDGRGHTALQVYAPGEFMHDRSGYMAFVGGCGVGQRQTEAEAEQLLLEKAIADCDRHIAYATRQLSHYVTQRRILLQGGLQLPPAPTSD